MLQRDDSCDYNNRICFCLKNTENHTLNKLIFNLRLIKLNSYSEFRLNFRLNLIVILF